MMRLIRHPAVERVLIFAKTAWDWTVAKLVGLILHWVKKLPSRTSTELLAKSGRLLAPILPRSSKARKNIAHAFPEMSKSEVNETVRAVWSNVARTVGEYVFLDKLFDYDPENPDAGNVEVTGIEHFLEIRDSDKPAILFTGHTGNWEILPIAAATHDLHVTALFRPPNNRFLAKRVLKARKTEGGHLVPSRAGAAWALAEVLENNGVVGLLADQAFTKGPHIDFLGRTATANPLAAKLARQYDCDIYPARCVRLPEGRFRIELHPKLEIPLNEQGVLDVVETTKAISKVIEGWVREYPDQWLWLHDRWKMKAPELKRWRR